MCPYMFGHMSKPQANAPVRTSFSIHGPATGCQQHLDGVKVLLDSQLCGTIKKVSKGANIVSCSNKLGRSSLVTEDL